MKLTPEQYAQALFEALQESSPQSHDQVMDNFVKILAQNGDLEKFDNIEEEFKKLQLKSSGIKDVEVTFAREMQSNKAILDDLNRIVGGKAEYTTKIDQGLVGGVQID